MNVIFLYFYSDLRRSCNLSPLPLEPRFITILIQSCSMNFYLNMRCNMWSSSSLALEFVSSVLVACRRTKCRPRNKVRALAQRETRPFSRTRKQWQVLVGDPDLVQNYVDHVCASTCPIAPVWSRPFAFVFFPSKLEHRGCSGSAARHGSSQETC